MRNIEIYCGFKSFEKLKESLDDLVEFNKTSSAHNSKPITIPDDMIPGEGIVSYIRRTTNS